MMAHPQRLLVTFRLRLFVSLVSVLVVLLPVAAGRLVAAAQAAQSQSPQSSGRIVFRWNGKHSVSCTLHRADDVEAKKLLQKWGTDAGKTSSIEVPAGDYVVRVLAPAFEAMPAHVRSDRTEKLDPKVGQIAFYWNGPDLVVCDLFNKDDADFKQQLGSFYALPGRSTVADIAPGSYLMRIAAPGARPIPVTVRAGKVTQVKDGK